MAEQFSSVVSSLEKDPAKQKIDERLNALIKEAKVTDKKESATNRFDAFKDLVQKNVSDAIKNKTAPWLNSHDGNQTLSYFPVNRYTPQGITALWLKVRESELKTSDPRWFSRKEIFDNGIKIRAGEKATIMSFKSGEEIKHSLYWNASQLDVPEYKRTFEAQKAPSKIYYPNSLHPRETLRSDFTNWFNSLKNHTPYEPKGMNRTKVVSEFLQQSKSGTLFFIARDASETSAKMNLVSQKETQHQKQSPELSF